MDGTDRASPVLVVGAGTTGLAMACEPARRRRAGLVDEEKSQSLGNEATCLLAARAIA